MKVRKACPFAVPSGRSPRFAVAPTSAEDGQMVQTTDEEGPAPGLAEFLKMIGHGFLAEHILCRNALLPGRLKIGLAIEEVTDSSNRVGIGMGERSIGYPSVSRSTK